MSEVFLSIEEVEEMCKDPPAGITQTEMMSYIARCKPHDFQQMRVPFPVVRLQHVTERPALRQILQLEGFIPSRSERDTRPGFKDLSFWSAQISGDDIEISRQQASDRVRRAVAPEDAETHHEDFQKQFAQSPAFDDISSRYGQYKFSFPLSRLLAWYGSQFCQGGKPQLRILGTDVYKKEIAHYIVVHGPGTDRYNGYPMVPTVQREDDLPGFVYSMNDTLFWRPETTSAQLHVKILKDGSVCKDYYEPRYCPWNHLGFAFHIPLEHHLKISRQDLLENLTPCEAGARYLGNNKDLNPSEVVKIIKDEFTNQSDDEKK